MEWSLDDRGLAKLRQTPDNQRPIAPPVASSGGSSTFNHDDCVPEDRILSVAIAYNKDPRMMKLNLGIKTEEGKPHVLNLAKKAEQQLVNDREPHNTGELE